MQQATATRMRTCKICSNPVQGYGNGGTMFCDGTECRLQDKRRVRRASIEKTKVWVDAYKVGVGCTDCGYNTAACALDFDHLPQFEKTEDVARLINANRADDIIMEEIEKCEVVCSNCHRCRTQERIATGNKPITRMVVPTRQPQITEMFT